MLCTLMYLTIIVTICAYNVDQRASENVHNVKISNSSFCTAAIIAHVVAQCHCRHLLGSMGQNKAKTAVSVAVGIVEIWRRPKKSKEHW